MDSSSCWDLWIHLTLLLLQSRNYSVKDKQKRKGKERTWKFYVTFYTWQKRKIIWSYFTFFETLSYLSNCVNCVRVLCEYVCFVCVCVSHSKVLIFRLYASFCIRLVKALISVVCLNVSLCQCVCVILHPWGHSLVHNLFIVRYSHRYGQHLNRVRLQFSVVYNLWISRNCFFEFSR